MKIGITGGIGSGKSYICQIIEKLGYPVFYSDQEAKLILENDETVRSELVRLVGNSVVKNGSLNREFLADKLFNSDVLRNQLNAIIHPAVRNKFNNWASVQVSTIVFNEAAILFETGSYKQFDKLILVVAPLEIRIDRTMKRSKLLKSEVESRIASQWSDNQKIPLADFILINDGQPLLVQIEDILRQIV